MLNDVKHSDVKAAEMTTTMTAGTVSTTAGLGAAGTVTAIGSDGTAMVTNEAGATTQVDFYGPQLPDGAFVQTGG